MDQKNNQDDLFVGYKHLFKGCKGSYASCLNCKPEQKNCEACVEYTINFCKLCDLKKHNLEPGYEPKGPQQYVCKSRSCTETGRPQHDLTAYVPDLSILNTSDHDFQLSVHEMHDSHDQLNVEMDVHEMQHDLKLNVHEMQDRFLKPSVPQKQNYDDQLCVPKTHDQPYDLKPSSLEICVSRTLGRMEYDRQQDGCEVCNLDLIVHDMDNIKDNNAPHDLELNDLKLGDSNTHNQYNQELQPERAEAAITLKGPVPPTLLSTQELHELKLNVCKFHGFQQIVGQQYQKEHHNRELSNIEMYKIHPDQHAHELGDLELNDLNLSVRRARKRPKPKKKNRPRRNPQPQESQPNDPQPSDREPRDLEQQRVPEPQDQQQQQQEQPDKRSFYEKFMDTMFGWANWRENFRGMPWSRRSPLGSTVQTRSWTSIILGLVGFGSCFVVPTSVFVVSKMKSKPDPNQDITLLTEASKNISNPKNIRDMMRKQERTVKKTSDRIKIRNDVTHKRNQSTSRPNLHLTSTRRKFQNVVVSSSSEGNYLFKKSKIHPISKYLTIVSNSTMKSYVSVTDNYKQKD